jgi:hypothetical protein
MQLTSLYPCRAVRRARIALCALQARPLSRREWMNFLGENVNKSTSAAGDSSSYLSSVIKDTKKDKVPTFEPSDLPGFVHPVVDGKADTSQYIASADADAAVQTGVAPAGIPRDQALKLVKG